MAHMHSHTVGECCMYILNCIIKIYIMTEKHKKKNVNYKESCHFVSSISLISEVTEFLDTHMQRL